MAPKRKRNIPVALRPDKLLRVLELEQQRGFDNKAVTGGTDRFILRWLGPAAEKARSIATRERLGRLAAMMRAYRAMDAPGRDAAAEAVRAELERLVQPAQEAGLGAPVSALDGIGPARALALSAEGVHTVGDLLLLLPHSYFDASSVVPVASLKPRQRACVRVKIVDGPQLFRGLRVSRVEAVAEDGSGRVLLVFFNQPWQAERLSVGMAITAVGRLQELRGRRAFVVEKVVSAPESGGRIVPSYRAGSVPEKVLRRAVMQALDGWAEAMEPVAPAEAAKAAGLLPRPESVRAVHRPQTLAQAEVGRRSLIFDQLLALQVRLLQYRARVRQPAEQAVIEASGLADEIQRLAGFSLTRAQRRVIEEIEKDLRDELPAYRLIHGDVGCGKTVVAAAALLAAAKSGAQAAMMAPTEILAEQHAARLEKLLGPANVAVHLLTGSMPQAEKRMAQATAAEGEPGIWVGTHALIQQSVEFRRLAVVVVDEQHRFGVAQRAALAQKGINPNFFAVSATPIPRTLALALYADFDISMIDEMPPGRRPVVTRLVGPEGREAVYGLVRERVANGQQAFVICPLIEASTAIEAEAATERFEELRTGPLSGLRVGLVHGKMATADRQAVMQAFYSGDIDVLVSTTVIEVGLDVPNASVIVVESAERFGLAQLHQLRGRVARSSHAPVCILVASAKSKEAAARLNILVQYADGLKIAEADLRLRGAGELAGLRQSGAGDWIVGNVLEYPDLLAAARAQAEKILAEDPSLSKPEHQGLAKTVCALGEIEAGRWAL